jgi:hypothetical protein
MRKGWLCGVDCQGYKKGDPSIHSNYRGITLLNTVHKIFSSFWVIY